ncbi:MAG: peptidylprolyl isomerase [Eubacteriales bacterium]|nr:peptidylprolyl isomerase [Eubacteriales bacterium]
MKKFLIILSAVITLSSCGTDYVATAGGERITTSEFNFYLSSIKSQMSDTELATEEDWQTQEIEGMKAIDLAKERALELAAENIAYIEIADYLDVELNDAEEANAEKLQQNFIAQYGGKKNYDIALKQLGVDDDFIEMLCESQIYSEKLAKLAAAENPVTDAERDAAFEKISNEYYNAKHILFATVDTSTRQPLSDEVKAEKKIKAEEVYQRILGGEDYDLLMNELSEDPGLETNPDGYLFGSGEMVPEFEQCTASLAYNEVGLVESSLGFHIIKRLPLDKASVSEQIESVAMLDKLTVAMDLWKEQAGFSVIKNEDVFRSIS